MAKNYVRPILSIDESITEGVYAASGSGCYTVTIQSHQGPQTGRADHRFQMNAVHKSDHTKDAQTLVITFNKPVNLVQFSNGVLVSGNGSSTLTFSLGYHQNPNDNIGLGELAVAAVGNAMDEDVSITSITLTD